MKKKQVVISLAAIALLLIGACVTWAMWPREAPQVKQAKELASKMFAEETTDEQRSEMRDQMRELRDSVPEDQRREVFRAFGEQMRERMTAHIREFAELPEDQRDEFLDRDIDRWENMRRAREEQRQQREESGDRGGDRAGGGDRGPGAGRPGGPGGRERWQNMTEQERQERRRSRLDNIPAEDRAAFTAYMEAMNKRRAERGLEPMRRPPFGRGRGPRG